ncbi:MAG: HNH endonuclease [Gammaproteobacteria bacterium]
MSRKGTMRLAALFQVEAERLALAEGRSAADVVKCPICLRELGRDAIATRELTIEHVIPRKVRGRLETVTCRRCNSTHGSNLDKHIVAAARARDALAGYRTLRATGRIDGARFEAEVLLHPDPSVTNEIRVIGAATDPRQEEAARENLHAPGAELNLSWSLGYIPNRHWLALLRAAYLGAFRHHGYPYVFAPSVTAIRRQILGDDPPSPHLNRIVHLVETPPVRLRHGLLEVDVSPTTGHHVYFVLVQTRLKLTTTYAVVLPHAGPEELGDLDKLAWIADSLEGVTLTFPVKRG